MITKESLTKENFAEMFAYVGKLRENVNKHDEALKDIRTLREFAIVNGLGNFVVESLLEEALVWQHEYMLKKDPGSLDRMEDLVKAAGNYASKNNLPAWESRLARFLGRIADYKKDYTRAKEYYQIALDKVMVDPNYAQNPALGYEYQGFAIMDKIRLGEVDLGIAEAKGLYEDYMLTEIGSTLRENDYVTWAIWRSGLFINLSRVLIELGVSDKYRNDILVWLEMAEQNLQVPEGVTVWADFSIRKSEIAELRGMLG